MRRIKERRYCLRLPLHLAAPQNYSNQRASRDAMYTAREGKVGPVLNIDQTKV